MVVVSLANGEVVEGDLKPSSDTPTHLVLYRAFQEIGGIAHTHSLYATAWAQAKREIPALGTTHADYFHGPVPCTRLLTAKEIKSDYEANTGRVIVERFKKRNPLHFPGALVACHAPFAWGATVEDAVENAVVLEHLARLASETLRIKSSIKPMPSGLLDKHFLRKHGPARVLRPENGVTMERISKVRVVPVVVIDRAEDAVPLAEALLAGGLNVMEITFRTPAAEQSIRKVRQAFPKMLVGAGTILDTDQLQQAIDAGAQFAVAPGLNEAVIKKSHLLNLPFVPGVMTPSDVEHGLALGCKLQKFFPAEVAGGIKMLKALAGPYAHTGIKFIPLGGVNASNAHEYLALPIVAAIGGSWMVERKLIAEKNWSTIRTLTAEAVQLAASVII